MISFLSLHPDTHGNEIRNILAINLTAQRCIKIILIGIKSSDKIKPAE